MRIDALEAAGATELLYAPMGPDIPRELRTFWEMATLKLGLFGVNMGSSATPDAVIATAQAAEAAGFESLWAGEHVVLPDPQAPPSPMAPQDGALDPLIALTWAAAHTSTHPPRHRDRHPSAAQPGRARQADREPRCA